MTPRIRSVWARSCLFRLVIGVGVTIVIALAFGVILGLGTFLDLPDKVWAVLTLVSIFGVLFLVFGGLIVWGVIVARKRTAQLDQAFLPLGLEGRGYQISGRQYAGRLQGRQVNAYFYISGGRYLRTPVLQMYVEADIPTRVALGERTGLTKFAGRLLRQQPVELKDPVFTDLLVFASEPDWAQLLFTETEVRAAVRDLMGEDSLNGVRTLVIGPGSISLILRGFELSELQERWTRSTLFEMVRLAQTAERMPEPRERLEESEVQRRFRLGRVNMRALVLALVGLVVFCPLVVVFAVAMGFVLAG